MTDADKRKGGGAKSTRSETVTVRLDPQVRYFAELAARSQRRTVSSFIEWAIEQSFSGAVELADLKGQRRSVDQARPALWDVDEADRFVRLAKWYPSLLTHDEQRLWKLVLEVWALRAPEKAGNIEALFEVQEMELLREHWELLQKSAEAGIAASSVVEAIQGNRKVRAGIEVVGNIEREMKKRASVKPEDAEG